MKEHKIDSLFKAKTGQGKFTYDPAYWAKAEKLLDAAPKAGGISAGIIGSVAVAIIGAALLLSFYTNAITESNTNPETSIALENAKIETKRTPTKTIEVISQENTGKIKQEKVGAADYNPDKNLSRGITQQKSTIKKPADTDSKTEAVATTKEQSQNKVPESAATPSAARIANNNDAAVINKTEGSSTAKNTSKPNHKNVARRAKIMVPEIGSNKLITRNSQELAQPTHYFEDESPEIMEHIEPLPKAFKPLENFAFALGADYSFLFASRILNGENSNYINFRKSNENPQHINSIGINAQVGYKNWLFNTGIYQTTIKEDIQYPSMLMVNVGVDNGVWNPYDVWTYELDSNWVVDSIYVGHWQQDTTWNVTQDSIYIAQWDTVQTEKEDPEIAKNNGSHTLTYVEVPLWFGRSFGAKRFTFDVQGGFAVGFLTTTNSVRYINTKLDGLVAVQTQKDQFQKVLFSAMLRAGVRFEIAPRWQAGVYPTLRYNLNSALNLNGVKQNYLGYGFNIGLSYRF